MFSSLKVLFGSILEGFFSRRTPKFGKNYLLFLHYEFQLSTSSRSKGPFFDAIILGESFDVGPKKTNANNS